MKPTIILVVVLLAGASAQELTPEARALEDTVLETHEKIDAIIESALQKAQETIHVAREKANELADEVTKKVDKQVRDLNGQITSFLENVNAKVEELVANSDNPHAGECAKITESVRDTATEVTANTSICLNEQISKAVQHVDNINDTSSAILQELLETRADSRECVKDLDGFKKTLAALSCLGKVGAKATWISVKKLPDITVHLGKLVLDVSRLPQTLSSCVISNGFSEVVGNSQELLDTVKKCVAQVTS